MTEQYTHGHHRSVVSAHATRRASDAAAFILPLIKPGMRLLDFGCGPGTITVDLAEKVRPGGSVVGIDSSAEVIAQAREHAKASGASNVQFEQGSIYGTGFEAGSFDVVFAHQVLQHLSEPVKALTEAKRVLRPGGICGVREVDWGTSAVWPSSRGLERFFEVYHEVSRRNGGNADAGRYVKSWFEQAGFADTQFSADTWIFTEKERLEWWGRQWAERILRSNIATRAVEYGIATEAELKEISQAWLEWMEAPGALFTFIHVCAIGTKR